MKRYDGEQYTEEESKLDFWQIVCIIVAVLTMIYTIVINIAYIKAKNDNKVLKQQIGQTYNLEGALTISKNDEQQIQVIYNGSSFFPDKIQIKEGIVFWDKDNRTYCADRTQVQIYIIALTKNA